MFYFICQNIDQFNSDINNVLLYLSELFNSGIGYSCIYTSKSALSSLIDIVTNTDVGSYLLVRRFMKGIF